MDATGVDCTDLLPADAVACVAGRCIAVVEDPEDVRE